jgi:hypothetical protein
MGISCWLMSNEALKRNRNMNNKSGDKSKSDKKWKLIRAFSIFFLILNTYLMIYYIMTQ